MKHYLIYGLFFVAILAPIPSVGASQEDLQSLIDDIRYGHYFTVTRIVPYIIKPNTAIRGVQTPLQVAKDELAKARYPHTRKNIRTIVHYLEGLELKWNL